MKSKTGLFLRLICLMLVTVTLIGLVAVGSFADDPDPNDPGSTTSSSESSSSENSSSSSESSSSESSSSESSSSESSSSESSSSSSESSSSETTTSEEEKKKDAEDHTPKITKHPGSETVTEGGSCVFIARADKADEIQWTIVGGNSSVYSPADAMATYNGLKVTTSGDNITLSNIPLSMSGCSVRAKFIGKGKYGPNNGNYEVTSDAASLTVRKKELLSPNINVNPHGGEVKQGETLTLAVTASDRNPNGTLNYQWYVNTRAVAFGGNAIDKATSYQYTPPTDTLGDFYYYVEVWSTENNELSLKTASTCAKVTVIDAKPTTETTESSEPSTEAQTTQETLPTTVTPQKPAKKSSPLLAILVILLILALAATVGLIIFMRWQDGGLPFDLDGGSSGAFSQKKSAGPAGSWTCDCGTVNRGFYCRECGNPRTEELPPIICETCGWQSADPNEVPEVCPVCGTPFLSSDIDFDI